MSTALPQAKRANPMQPNSDFYERLNLKVSESRQILADKIFKAVESLDVDIEYHPQFRKGYFRCVDDVLDIVRRANGETDNNRG